MASSLQEILDAEVMANAAAYPALDGVYQPTDYENAQAADIKRQQAEIGQQYKGSEIRLNPMSWNEYQSTLPQEPEAPPTLQGMVQEPQTPEQVTKCQMGFCGNNSGIIGNGQPFIQRNFEKGVIAGGDFGLYGQLVGNARRRAMGATTDALEKSNREMEQYKLADMRRSPEWYQNYQTLSQQYPNDPDLAMKQSDLMTGNQFGGDYASTSQQYFAPAAQKAVDAYGDQRNALGVMLGNDFLSQNPYENMGQGTVAPRGNLTSYAPNEDGTNAIGIDINGQQYNTSESPDLTLPFINSAGLGGGTSDVYKYAQAADKTRMDALKSNATIDQKNQQNLLRKAEFDQKLLQSQQKITQAKTGGTNTTTGLANNPLTATPEAYTAKGRAAYLNSLKDSRETEERLRTGNLADGSERNPINVATGFAPTMRVSDEILNVLVDPRYSGNNPNSAIAHTNIKRYNEVLDRLSDQEKWADEASVLNTLKELYEVKKLMEPQRDAWLNSKTAKSVQTGREVESGLNYISIGIKDAEQRLKRYEDIRKAQREQEVLSKSIQQMMNTGEVGGL